MNHVFKFTLINLFFLFSIFNANAGFLKGRVIGGENDTLFKATIQLVELKKGGFSQRDGTFLIKDIPAGTYTLRVSYIGYESKVIKGVKISKNDTTNINVVKLISDIKQTDEVIVEGRREMSGQAAVIDMRKKSIQVADMLSSEDMKRAPDSDIGQSLRRVSGVTLMEGKHIYVRGVSERYSITTLNGANLATTETDKNAFAFDMLPADFIENASVAKSFTPDLSGNFAGGLVQLNTVKFPTKSGWKFSFGASGSDNLTFQNNFLRFAGGKTDWLGFDDGTRKLDRSLAKSTPMEYNTLLNSLKNSSDEKALQEATNQWLAFGNSFSDKVWKQETISAPLNGSYSLSYSGIYEVGKVSEIGLVASANYGNSYSSESIVRSQMSGDGSHFNYFGTGEAMNFSTNLGGIFNIAYRLDENNIISLKNTYNHSSDDKNTIIEGYKEQNEIRQYASNFIQKSLYAGQLSWEYKNLAKENALLDLNLGYSTSNREEPDFRRVRYSRNNPNEDYRVDIYNLDGNGYQAGRMFSDLIEDAYTASMNYTFPIFGDENSEKFKQNLKLKFGGLYEMKQREFDIRSFTIVKSTFVLKNIYDDDFGYVVPNVGDEEFYDSMFSKSPAEIFNNENFTHNRLGYSEETKPTDAYKADETQLAGYLMGDWKALEQLRFIAGARVEVSNQNLSSYYKISSEGTDSLFSENSYVDLLPSVNVIYSPLKGMNLRASVSRTLTRPTLRECAPFTYYDYEWQGDVSGNPNLERALIWNYDLRWEYFLNPGEVLSASFFYKSFTNAIEETIIPTSSNFKRTFANADGLASSYGVELEFRKNLGFITYLLSDFMVNCNLAFINSEITVEQVGKTETRQMWGQSPYTLNLGLYYYNHDIDLGVDVSYNIFGKRIIQVADISRYSFENPHVYELPRNLLDLSIRKTIFNNLELKLVAKDILCEKSIWEQGGKQVANGIRGRGFSLGISYKL